MPIGQIQIRTEPAKLQYDVGPGRYDIRQPRPTVDMRQPRADLRLEQPLGMMTVDSSRAWDALGVGGNLEMMNRIYSQLPDIARQGVAKIVERGNRLAEIHNPADPVPELAQDWHVSFPEFDTSGEASYDNVDIHYEPARPVIEASANAVEINVQVNPPIVQYERGPTNFEMAQYGKVEITPPSIDLSI